MLAPIVRTDYDQLTMVAARFDQQADLARQCLEQLRQQQETLESGDWLGAGAQAFYAEMNAQVVPSLHRLIKALEAAQQTTRQIGQVMKGAEDEAARILRATGAASPAGAATGFGAASAGVAGDVGAMLANAPAGNGGAAGLATGAGIAFTGKPPSASAFQPPSDTSTPIGTAEDVVGILGSVATVIDILETGGTAAGIGASMGAYVLPIGTFLLGLKWGMEEEAYEQREAAFIREMTTSASRYAVEQMLAVDLQPDGTRAWPFDTALNEAGKRRLQELDSKWKLGMTVDLKVLLQRHKAAQYFDWDNVAAPTVEEWQAVHDKWARGAWAGLSELYSDPEFRQPTARAQSLPAR